MCGGARQFRPTYTTFSPTKNCVPTRKLTLAVVVGVVVAVVVVVVALDVVVVKELPTTFGQSNPATSFPIQFCNNNASNKRVRSNHH